MILIEWMVIHPFLYFTTSKHDLNIASNTQKLYYNSAHSSQAEKALPVSQSSGHYIVIKIHKC